MKAAVLGLSVIVVLAFAGFILPAHATTPSFTGTIGYYEVVSNSCSSSNPIWPAWAPNGAPGLPNNGPSGDLPVVNEGASICIVVTITSTNQPDGTYTVTSPAFGGSFNVVISGGSGSGSGILQNNDAKDSQANACNTHPIKINGGNIPEGGYNLAHILLANSDGVSTCSTTTTTSSSTTQTQPGVPQFPGALGLLLVVGITIPAMVLLRRGLPKF